MKKTVLVFLSVLFSITALHSQNDSLVSQTVEDGFGIEVQQENMDTMVALSDSVTNADSVLTVEDAAHLLKMDPVVDDETVLSNEDKMLPDSAKNAKELLMMRDLNPKDSLLEEKKVPEKRFITVGYTVGLTMTTYGLAGMDGESASFGPGAQVAINCDIPLGQTPICQYLSIQPELILSFRTTGLDLVMPRIDEAGDPVGARKYEATDRLLYMCVPVNVKASMRYKKGRPFVSLAPMLSVGLFGKRVSDETADFDYSGDEAIDLGDCSSTLLFQADTQEAQQKPLYNNIDFSLYSKVGYDFDSGLSVSLAFQLGLTDMMKSDGCLMKTRCLSLNVGYNF